MDVLHSGRPLMQAGMDAMQAGRPILKQKSDVVNAGRLIFLSLFAIYFFLALYDGIAELLFCTETSETGGGGKASGFDIALVVIAEDDAALTDLVADVEDLVGMIGEDGYEKHGCGPTADGVTRWIRSEVGR